MNHFFKVLNLDENLFDDVIGEAETLAGLILELKGEMPRKNEVIKYKEFLFSIKSVDQRRIKQIQVTLKDNKSPDENKD